jgi:hypothetical protein
MPLSPPEGSGTPVSTPASGTLGTSIGPASAHQPELQSNESASTVEQPARAMTLAAASGSHAFMSATFLPS